MRRNYNLSHRLIAYILFGGLFLQSCGGFQNQVIPQEKKESSKIVELSDHTLIHSDKAIVASGGYLASFYEEDGELKADLKADEKQPKPNYKGVPVVVEEGMDLTYLTKLDPTTQKSLIELNRSHGGQLRHITIRKGGLSGGMMEEETNTTQLVPMLLETKELKKYFLRGYLEITPINFSNIQAILDNDKYRLSFANYDGGVYVKGWKDGQDLDSLVEILLEFNKIKKFKIDCIQEEGSLQELMLRAVQFYEELVEIDLSGSRITEGTVEDIKTSIPSPEKLLLIQLGNNAIENKSIDSLRQIFLRAKIKICQEVFQPIENLQKSVTNTSSTASETSLAVGTNITSMGNNNTTTISKNTQDLEESSSSSWNDSSGENEDKKEKEEKDSIKVFHVPEIHAYKKLNLNQFLPTISKDEIKYGRELGRGGFGAVYQASCQGDNVAIKKLLNASEKQVADFQKEAIIMANHRHNNIVAFLGYCPEENALLMEYMPGGSLASILRSPQEISWQERYQIALDVAEGMSYLHDLGIVHCDLKSDNVLLDSNRRAKVTDFGISVLKNENSTYGEWLGGTYRWMAPEIFYTSKNSKGGDVYSYGMILWELGARKLPFVAIKSIPQLCEHIKAGNQEVVSADTPHELKKVIKQCWLYEPPLKKETDRQDRPTMKRVRYLLEKGHPNFSRREYDEQSFPMEKEQDKSNQLKQKALHISIPSEVNVEPIDVIGYEAKVREVETKLLEALKQIEGERKIREEVKISNLWIGRRDNGMESKFEKVSSNWLEHNADGVIGRFKHFSESSRDTTSVFLSEFGIFGIFGGFGRFGGTLTLTNNGAYWQGNMFASGRFQ